MSEFIATESQALNSMSRKPVISEIGVKYRVVVGNVTPFHKVVGSGVQTHIVNIQALTPYLKQQALEAFIDEDFTKAYSTNLTMTVFEGRPCPVANDLIDVRLHTYTNKDGVECIGIESWSEVAAVVAKTSTAEALAEEIGAMIDRRNATNQSPVTAPEVIS